VFRFLTDEDFDGDVIRGLRLRLPGVDLVRVVDVGLGGGDGADDPAILAWAAATGRIVLTQDRTTMTAHARARMAAGKPMPGLFVIDGDAPIGRIIDDLVVYYECSEAAEWAYQIKFLPIR
jgi:hypothetical protein